jgi:hypothetical protein
MLRKLSLENNNDEDPDKRKKWQAAILFELEHMMTRKVWRKVASKPEGRRPVGCKWILRKNKMESSRED